jgi:alpha-beta hydrolase superfamily lysophospholipase
MSSDATLATDVAVEQGFEASDGTHLTGWLWRAEASTRGCVVVVHGLSEHARRYGPLARRLAADGWNVFALDLRGHGASPGKRGVLESFPRIAADIGQAVDQARHEWSNGGPVVLFGHSLGGLAVLRAVQARDLGLDALVLCAPWLGEVQGVRAWQRGLVRLLARVAPRWTVGRTMNTDTLMADEEMAAQRRADPLVHTRMSAGLLVEVERAKRRARAGRVDPKVPVLVIVPGDDRLLDHRHLRTWIAGQPEARIEVKEWPGRRHEPLNDVGRDEVIEHLAGWISQHAEGSNRAPSAE